MATIPRPNVVHLAQGRPPFPLPEQVTVGLAAFQETVREGLLAFCVGVGLSVVAEIFEEEITQLVGPRGKHDRERTGYRHGQEDRQLNLGGRRVEVQKPRAPTKAGGKVELESFRFFAGRDLLTQAAWTGCWRGFRRAATEPVGVEPKATTRSSISRRFVAGTTRKLDKAWQEADAEKAEQELRNLARQLQGDHPGAAASLREGIEETLRVTRLHLSPSLLRTFKSTNRSSP